MAEILGNAKTLGEFVKKGQKLGKLFTQAQAAGDPVKQTSGRCQDAESAR